MSHRRDAEIAEKTHASMACELRGMLDGALWRATPDPLGILCDPCVSAVNKSRNL
jgi:hypothetical protein